MPSLVLTIVLIVVIVLVVRRLTGAGGGSAKAFVRSKCADCIYCRKLFDDGTLCGFGKAETFKNEVHVGNCVDHRRR